MSSSKSAQNNQSSSTSYADSYNKTYNLTSNAELGAYASQFNISNVSPEAAATGGGGGLYSDITSNSLNRSNVGNLNVGLGAGSEAGSNLLSTMSQYIPLIIVGVIAIFIAKFIFKK